MHLPTTLLLLPLLVAADSQAPLRDQAGAWFDKAKAFVSNNIPNPQGSVDELPNPIDAGAGRVAGTVVEKINVRNWQRKLAPKPDIDEEWMIFLTGGNKTCYGKCHEVNLAWNKSVPLLEALPQSAGSSRLKLGLLDCEKDEVLCTAWASGVPVIYHFLLPAKSTPEKPVPLHVVPMNITNTQVQDIVDIPSASKSRYLKFDEYTGILHPMDGTLAQLGLLQPFGYFMWALGSMPGWAMMLGISFVSRQIMSKRMQRSGGIPQAGGAGAAAPEPRVAPATGAQPRAGGAPGSAKKRK